MKKLFKWIGRNERHISTAVFLGGFIIDNIAYERVDLPWVHTLFTGFLIAAALCIIVSHVLRRERPDAAPSTKNPLYTLIPIAAQFFLGALLSGCVIFYTRSAAFGVSWPFLLLLAIVFIGNEVFRKYRERLAFQCVLFFFTLYAYAIFALPIARGTVSSLIFVESGVVSVVTFALFLWLLSAISKKRFVESLRSITIWSAGLLVVVNVFYFTGLIPPLPLALRDAGVYHSIVRTGNSYQVATEAASSHFFSTQVVHHVPGTPLYAFSAIFAPVQLSAPIVHRWQKYDDAAGEWETIAAAAFSIAGGRDGGYRGYSMITDPTPGKWRVSIETDSGGVLGRVRFDVENVSIAPQLYTGTK